MFFLSPSLSLLSPLLSPSSLLSSLSPLLSTALLSPSSLLSSPLLSSPLLPSPGMWEEFTYGLFGLYREDWNSFGGFSIEKYKFKWGGEDWDLLDK